MQYAFNTCSLFLQSVYMAHALKRISYATCDPDFCQFSFLAREPKANLSMQFCHAFMTSSKEEVREWPVAVSCIKSLSWPANTDSNWAKCWYIKIFQLKKNYWREGEDCWLCKWGHSQLLSWMKWYLGFEC